MAIKKKKVIVKRMVLTDAEYLMKKLKIRQKRNVELLSLCLITHFEIKDKKIYIYLFGGGHRVVYCSMKEMLEVLPLPHFIMIHESYIANRHYASGYTLGAKSEVTVNGKKVKVSRTYRDAMVDAIDAICIIVPTSKKRVVKPKTALKKS